jgi:hypothetical protein
MRIHFYIDSYNLQISSAVVEPYNAILTTHSAIGCTDVSFIYDNEALYDICINQLDIRMPHYPNVNRVIAQVFSAMTAAVRFEGTASNILRFIVIEVEFASPEKSNDRNQSMYLLHFSTNTNVTNVTNVKGKNEKSSNKYNNCETKGLNLSIEK